MRRLRVVKSTRWTLSERVRLAKLLAELETVALESAAPYPLPLSRNDIRALVKALRAILAAARGTDDDDLTRALLMSVGRIRKKA